MTAARIIPSAVRGVQIDAADPDVSVFVSANAGSGKTYVLAQRVINLLLRGVDPAKILCITFTKAAAANMATQVFNRLAAWTALDDKALDHEIALNSGSNPNGKQRVRARRLFASALETPGGLKVQTIHAFCTRLLQQFPFEANVAVRFTVLDDASTAQLLDDLTLRVLLEAAAKPSSALGRALATAIVMAADQTFKDVVGDAIRKRDTLRNWIAQAGGLDAATAALSQALGIDANDSMAAVETEYFEKALIPNSEWPVLLEILAAGSKNDQKHIDALEGARTSTGRDRINAYLKVFCTAKREPRENILTKKLGETNPDWLQRLQDEQTRVCKLLARERAIRARERTVALITIANEVIARYQVEKDRRAVLDYDDLIDKTLVLFSNVSATWVLYKLDLGIDHVLVDEAQDTSPKQWEIIRTIVSEFTPSGGRPNVRRTMFAVGDEKQSIFSFQGAAPHRFDEMRRQFEKQFDTPELGWRYLHFHHSFRSGANVLSAVDKVFKTPEVYASVTSDQSGMAAHESLPDAGPGLVEIWPLIAAEKRADIEGWDAPFDKARDDSPQVLLARRIANSVRLWIERGTVAKDVLILVRQRGPLFEAIIRALKNAQIAVAGADRLVLTEHIAVMDLIALGDALLLPDDDLALASVLKSPLFGIAEEQLFTLAWDRKGSLRASLRAKANDNAAFAAAGATLDDLASAARTLSPFAFYAHVLGAMRGRARVLARLGPEANDAIDEFLNLALDYETRETPSLQGFLAWMRATKVEVKRDMEMERDEVRVMTVHGAKGLEANTVILADTTTRPTGPHDPKLLSLPNGALIWATAKSEDDGAMTRAREQSQSEARDEYRRLLYVAMTRAKEKLIVCGTQGMQKIPDGCWYALVQSALCNGEPDEPSDDGNENVWRYRTTPNTMKTPLQSNEKQKKQPRSSDWLTKNAASDPTTMRTLRPSSAGEDGEVRSVANDDRRTALARGSLVHRLMQSLPDVPPERREKITKDFLKRAGTNITAEQQRSIAAQVLLMLREEHCSALFGPGSRAEVPVVGTLTHGGKTFRVAGQIDRLVVTQDFILIADFKTNRPTPRRIADVPKAYVTQLALYRALLARLYPGKQIRAALIWTEVPDLMELSAEALDAALAKVISA